MILAVSNVVFNIIVKRSIILLVRRVPATILVATLNFTIGLAPALDIEILVNQVLFSTLATG